MELYLYNLVQRIIDIYFFINLILQILPNIDVIYIFIFMSLQHEQFFCSFGSQQTFKNWFCLVASTTQATMVVKTMNVFPRSETLCAQLFLK